MSIIMVTSVCLSSVVTQTCDALPNNGGRDLLTSPHRAAECTFLLVLHGQMFQNSDNSWKRRALFHLENIGGQHLPDGVQPPSTNMVSTLPVNRGGSENGSSDQPTARKLRGRPGGAGKSCEIRQASELIGEELLRTCHRSNGKPTTPKDLIRVAARTIMNICTKKRRVGLFDVQITDGVPHCRLKCAAQTAGRRDVQTSPHHEVECGRQVDG